MAYCPICEKKFDTRKGLQGHFRFKHKYELKQDKPARETPLTRLVGRSIERRQSGDALMEVLGEKKDEAHEPSKPRVSWTNINRERGSRDGEKRIGRRILWE